MKITVKTKVQAPLNDVWKAWTTPADINKWNSGHPDWHTVNSTVDLRVGGKFSSRMEAKDGSMGFDFAGEYVQIIDKKLIETQFGDRRALAEFTEDADGVTVTQTFDAETENSEEMQRQGWQTIMDNFAKHVDGK